MFRRSLWTVALLAIVTLMLCAAGEASAARRTPRRVPRRLPAHVAPAPAAPAPASAGMRIEIDPVSRSLMAPTAGTEAHSIESGLQARESLPVEVLPNGTRRVRLDERFMDYAVIRLNPDGTRSQECVQGAEASARAVKTAGKPLPLPVAKGEVK